MYDKDNKNICFLFFVFLIFLIHACYQVKKENVFSCSLENPQCPNGLTCLDNQCVLQTDGGSQDRSDPLSSTDASSSKKQDLPPEICLHPPITSRCEDGRCYIPAGCFQMGTPKDDLCWTLNENRHQVTLTHNFFISETEVTQESFHSLMGYLPDGQITLCPACPVWATWTQAVTYCNALSQKDGYELCYYCKEPQGVYPCEPVSNFDGKKIYQCKGFRLPTDAEWEYAYRAGSNAAFYNDGLYLNKACKNSSCFDDVYASTIGWYCANSEKKIHPVGQKLPNAWGLFDMAGNLDEWCHDHYQADLGGNGAIDPAITTPGYNVLTRGGSFSTNSWYLRGAARIPMRILGSAGFRCVRTTDALKGNPRPSSVPCP